MPLLHLPSYLAGMVHCIRTIAAQEGVPSLWKGLTPFLGQLTLKYALRMGSNAFFLELMRDKVGSGVACKCACSLSSLLCLEEKTGSNVLPPAFPCAAGCLPVALLPLIMLLAPPLHLPHHRTAS